MDDDVTARPRTGRLQERLRRPRGDAPAVPATPARRDGTAPLSPGQQRLWALDRLRPGGADYVVPIVLRLRGDLAALDLGAAFTELVRRHEILRTRYGVDASGEPIALVDPPSEVKPAFTDLTGATPTETSAVLQAAAARPIDLATGPVLRVTLMRLAPDEHLLLILTHHIAVDGWAASLLVDELAALCDGRDLPPPDLQYSDFALRQQVDLADGRAARGLAYWTGALAALPPLELPTDRSRPPVWEADGTTLAFRLPAELGRRVTKLAGDRRATPYMVYLAALWALLHRYTGQTDLAVASPVAGRSTAESQRAVGSFVNLLVLRADLAGEPSFAELVEQARRRTLDALSHQEVPFERIVQALGVERDPSRHPLVNVNLTLQNNRPVRFSAGPVIGEPVAVVSERAKFDLSWILEEQADGTVAGEAVFPHALFDVGTVERMAGHFVRLLDAAVAEPDRAIGALPMLAEDELARLVRGPVDPGTRPRHTLHGLFAERVAELPDAIAVTFGDEQVSYRELDERANGLAHRLRELGAGPEELVAICLPRGVELVVAVLAVLKAGAAYLPLEPEHPADRLAHVLDDATARLVVTETALLDRLPGTRPTAVVLDALPEAVRPAGPPETQAGPDTLAYVIYTSGSTGHPKGVQVTHAHVLRLFATCAADHRFGPDDVWTLCHSYAFDFSVWEIWGALLHGGRLVVVPQDTARSPWALAELLAEQGVTVLNQTPSAFRGLAALAGEDASLDRQKLRLVILGGEAVDVAALRPWWDRFGDTAPQIVNMYGITETTVHVTRRPLDLRDLRHATSPIGRPLDDLSLYVLDERMRPVPVGAPGEIYVGGAGVARGYRNRPGLTAERFVPDPYGPPGGRLYRTGDKARVLPDAGLVYLGRSDDQVKIRGFRIELGEVEACLRGHPELADAVVTVHEPAAGERQLVGYAVPLDGAAVTVRRLRAYLADRLPGYMMPGVLMIESRLPLTVNGKVDRAALPAPVVARGRADGTRAPRNADEERMAAVWARVLGVPQVGADDNFFELGGDSIMAIRLVGALRAAGFACSVTDLFRYQDVAGLAGLGTAAAPADQAGTPPFALVAPQDREKLPDGVVDAYPMTQGQLGMVYELLADPDTMPYHNVTTYLIRDDEPFDAGAFASALDDIVARHEILRTSFDLSTYSEPLQLVHSRVDHGYAHTDLRGLPPEREQADLAAFRDQERSRGIDVAAAPLFRLHTHEADGRWHLSLTECHAILDGWSHNSLVSDLLTGYQAARGRRPAPPRPAAARFADFVAQERASLADTADHAFWEGRLAGSVRLEFPVSWSDPEGPASYRLTVPFLHLEPRLRELAALAGASLKSVLLAAHVTVWRAVAGPGPFVTGLLCNGRSEVEGGDQVRGMFLNLVPFAAPTAPTWRELVRAVFAEEVALWPHRRFPLPEMQRRFGDGTPLVRVAFNYLDFHVLDRRMVDTEGSVDVSPNEVPFALSAQGGDLILTGHSAMIGRRHAEVLAEMYERVLALMAADPDGGTLSSLPPERRRTLLAAGVRGPCPEAAPTVHLRVEEHPPGRVAVEASGEHLTYGELRRRASVWAGRLRRAGVGPGDLVGICLPRTADMIAAVLGVLRAGAAYVPLDPEHPPARLGALLADADTRVVIAEETVHLPPGAPPVLVPGPSGPAAEEVHAPDPDAPVYVVHTSGSTGRPKGVVVPHRALAGRVRSLGRNLPLGPDSVVVAVVPTTTDVAQLAVFAALVHGGRLVLADADLVRDPVSLAELLRVSGATMMQASPTTWRMLAESGWTPPAGFQVLSGGEPLDAALARRMDGFGAHLWDNYGPTETTVFSFGTRVGGTTWIPDGTRVYLLDDFLEPVLDGVPGQVYVAGDGLAIGYLGRPGATADAFLPDPHAAEAGTRMYATGDVGRRGPDGRIEVLGRRDHQVKIRGLRVETGEVEAVLRGHPDVRAAVVHPVPGPAGEAVLAAYLVLDNADLDGVRRHAAEALPAIMVPTHFVPMSAYPRLANGKVDRAALPAPGSARPAAGAYEPPRGPVEEAIAAVWAEALGVARVGRDDDFFALGGHSLLTLRIVARLRDGHGMHVSLRDLLRCRTVRNLAAAAPDASAGKALLWLGESGTKAPLFCVHPGGGSAHWYRGLADLYAGERPVAAFQWPGLDGDHRLPGNVAEIAAAYVTELRTARPTGPYHLLGWSGSAGIAWEMAGVLGEDARLILLDPVIGGTADRLEPLRLAEDLLASLADGGTQERAVRDRLDELLRPFADNGELWTAEDTVDRTWLDRVRSWRRLLEARTGHQPTARSGRLDLILSDEHVARRDAVAAWHRLARDGVRIHRTPGDHLGALRPPHLRSLAACLTDLMDGTDPRAKE